MMRGVSLTLLLVFLFHISLSGADFSWSDCGVQLTRDIHYESASISPSSTIQTSGSLSINVQATILSTIYTAETRLIVLKDGEEFLDVYVQDLCTLLETASSSLSCPLPVGKISFTYTFTDLPPLPGGQYDFQVHSVLGDEELGCIELSDNVGNLQGQTGNYYTSNFSVAIAGTPVYQVSNPTARTVGQYIQVGPGVTNGNYGTFPTHTAQATVDLGGPSIDVSSYVWSLNGSMYAQATNGTKLVHYYSGTFGVDYVNGSIYEPFLSGLFNWTYVYDPAGTPTETISGTFILDPEYVFFSNLYTYPVVLGNLEPFVMSRQSDGTLAVVGSRQWCTAGYDSCNVCGGDGTTCIISAKPAASSTWSDREYAAVIVGVVGGVLGILAVSILSYMVVKAKRATYHDDSDLIDHPQKPDYGTMAIDDIMREGERAPF